MLGLPVHPRLARMLVAEPTSLGCALAALVDERDVMRGRLDELPSDLGLRVQLLAGRTRHDLADRRAVDRLRDRALPRVEVPTRFGVSATVVDAVDRPGAVCLLEYPDGYNLAGQLQVIADRIPEDVTLGAGLATVCRA